ncbi:hypothetical protein [Neptunomonas sp.]|uniref:hypothetical protein n=1 Tax=Neptunomonas sp. TaxID=1971898 RepID=UPI00356A893B
MENMEGGIAKSVGDVLRYYTEKGENVPGPVITLIEENGWLRGFINGHLEAQSDKIKRIAVGGSNCG